MTNPQPHIPTDCPNAGVPLCQEACPHCIAPFDGCVADCKLTDAECILDNPCLPAVRQMAAKLRDVRELAESKLPQEQCGKNGCTNTAHRRGCVGSQLVWTCEEHAGEIEMWWPDATEAEVKAARDVLAILDREGAA